MKGLRTFEGKGSHSVLATDLLSNDRDSLARTLSSRTYLNTLDLDTNGTIDASAVTTVTGSLSAVATAYASSGITGLGNEAVTLDDTTVAAADLNALDLLTSGTIDATTVTALTGSLSDVATAYASSGISGLGNEAVTLSDTTLAASALNALDGETSGVVDASTVMELTGSASDVAASYAANTAGTISGLGDEYVTLDDTTLAASDLNALDGETSGAISAFPVTELTGSLSDVAEAYASSGISDLGDESVTLDDTTVAASDLNALDGETSGVVDATTVTELTGSASDVAAAYASSGISGLGNADVTLDDTTVAAGDLNAIDTATNGMIDATTVTALTGSLSDVAEAYASSGISDLGDESVTLDDLTVAAADLNALDGETSGAISASTVTELTGSASDVADAYASSGISDLGNEAVTLAAGTMAAGDLNAIDTATSGTIDASAVTTLTGSLSDVADAYASSGSGTGNAYTLTVTGTTATAINLNKVDAVTTIAVDVSAITTVTGALSDVATAYASAGLSGLGNEAVTLSDTTVAAAALNALDLLTSGTIDATTVTTVTGSLSDVADAYASSGISDLGEESVTLDDLTVAAADPRRRHPRSPRPQRPQAHFKRRLHAQSRRQSRPA